MKRTRWLYDLGAIVLVLGYIWLANRTEGGAADPVWRRVQERGVLRVGTDIGFVPFVAGAPDGRLSGYDVELVNEIARRLGWRVEWRQVGYDALFSAIDGNNPNQVDLLAAGILLNPGESWRARFSTAYFDGGQQLLVGLDSALGSQADLHSQRIAVQLGSPAETAARQIASGDPTITIINTAETQAAAVEMLLAGTADAAVVDNASALPFIHRGQVRQAGGLTFEPIVLATPVAAYQLSAEVNRVIGELQQEGWIAELNQRWFR